LAGRSGSRHCLSSLRVTGACNLTH
jgi:hypothetical protein